MLYHAYRRRADAFSIGREALLDEIRWTPDGWPAFNERLGPSLLGPSPLGVQETPDEREVFDGFNEAELDPAWEWPWTSTQVMRAEPKGGGHLLLTTGAAGPPHDQWAGAVLARRTFSGDYTATTRVIGGGPGTAGLAAYSGRERALGISTGGGKVFVWRREGKREELVRTDAAPSSESIFLRMTAAGGETYRFSYSANGREWLELGGVVSGSHLENARVALTAGGPAGSVAKFDWFRVTPARKK